MLTRRALLIGASLVGATTRPTLAQALDISPVAAIRFADGEPRIGDVAERMRHYGVPALCVAVFSEGRVRTATFGPGVDARTIFQAGSISKAVAAIGAMQLVQAGRIGLDEDVRPRLRNWTLSFAQQAPEQSISLRQLLSHTAGVNVESYPGFAPDEAAPDLTAILDGAPIAHTPRVQVSEAPGVYRYSGGGYEVIEKLIEDISGQSFVDYMARHVLRPAGMARSTYAPILPSALSANVAGGHAWDGAPRDPPFLIYPQHAAASLWSTPSDLARLFSALMQSARGHGRLLSPTLARAMMTEVNSGMGLGLGAQGDGAAKIISHAGWTRGYRSYFAGFPASGEGIVVMAGGDRGNELAMEIVRGVAASHNWPGFAPRDVTRVRWSDEQLRARAGDYNFADAGFSITVSAEGDHLIALTPRGASYTLYPIGADTVCGLEDGEIGVFDGGGRLSLWGMQAVKQ